jgi:hypothetical protein
VLVGGPARQAEGLGLRQPGEGSQGDQAGAEAIFAAEVRERLVEVDQVVAGGVERHGAQVEVEVDIDIDVDGTRRIRRARR